MNEREQYEAFKSSCRTYLQEKEVLSGMDANTSDPVLTTRYRYLKEDVEYTEKMLNRIAERCGTNAKLMVYELFVENRTQASVAEQYHLSRRQLQYSLEKWMETAFRED